MTCTSAVQSAAPQGTLGLFHTDTSTPSRYWRRVLIPCWQSSQAFSLLAFTLTLRAVAVLAVLAYTQAVKTNLLTHGLMPAILAKMLLLNCPCQNAVLVTSLCFYTTCPRRRFST